jgi:hypothetical protein
MSYWCTVTYASAYTGSEKPVSCSTLFRRCASASADSASPVALCRSAGRHVEREGREGQPMGMEGNALSCV